MKTLTPVFLALLLTLPAARAAEPALVCAESAGRFLTADLAKPEEQFVFRGLEAAGIASGVAYSSLGGTSDDSDPDQLVFDFAITKGKLPPFGTPPADGGLYPTMVRLVKKGEAYRAEVYAGVFGAFGRPAFRAACRAQR